jgi:hypothetical protein
MVRAVARLVLLLKIATGALAFLLYVWFAAVRLAPRAKLRKAVRRTRRLRTDSLQARQSERTIGS